MSRSSRLQVLLYEGAGSPRGRSRGESYAASNQESRARKHRFPLAVRLAPGRTRRRHHQGKEGTASKVRKLFEVKASAGQKKGPPAGGPFVRSGRVT